VRTLTDREGRVDPDDPQLDETPGRLWVWYCTEDDTVAKASCPSSEYFDGAPCPACGETMLGPFIYRLIRPARWFTGQRGRSTENVAPLRLPEPSSKVGDATGLPVSEGAVIPAASIDPSPR